MNKINSYISNFKTAFQTAKHDFNSNVSEENKRYILAWSIVAGLGTFFLAGLGGFITFKVLVEKCKISRSADSIPTTSGVSSVASSVLSEDEGSKTTSSVFGNVYSSAENTKKRVEALRSEGKAEYVSFCNDAALRLTEESDTSATWKIHISVDPDQVEDAIDILYSEIEKSDLIIHGKVHTATKEPVMRVQPGKQFALIVLDADSDKKEWLTLLTNIAKRFKEKSIKVDSRAINSDPEQSWRKWDATIEVENAPPYFNYRTDSFTVIEDDEDFEDFTIGYSKLAGTSSNVRFAPGTEGYMIKRSYFESLPEDQKHNPTNVVDFLEDITITI